MGELSGCSGEDFSRAVDWGLLKRLNGKTFALTGKLSVSRVDISNVLYLLGARVSPTVISSTNFLLVPDDQFRSSSKFQAAVRLGVTILTEAQFCEMILPSAEELLTGGRNDGSEYGSEA